MRNDICLVLTAAIEVKNKSIVKRNNTQTRLEDYKASLKKWLAQKNMASIVFVENSGYPLDELKKVPEAYNPLNKKVEFLQYVADGKDLNHISYGELMLMKYAIDNSELIKRTKYVMQVSGRAYIQNIDEIVNNLPDFFDIAGVLEVNLSYMQINVVAYQKEFFYRYVYKAATETLDAHTHTDLERVFAKATHMAIIDDYRWYPFPVEPIVIGVGGTKNRSYGRGWWFSFKGTVASWLYYGVYRTAYNRKKPHMLDKWNLAPNTENGKKHLAQEIIHKN